MAGPRDDALGEVTPGEAPTWVEIRVLGPLRVRAADGRRISDREWRTGKNADLLRWLALEAGTAVPAERLAESLWPDVEEAKARASLRTAVSHLRRLLGPEVIERVANDVLLSRAWVDAASFTQLAEDVARLRREGRAVEALAAVREADALYLADVPVGDGSPETVMQHSTTLAHLRRQLLGDAADLAVELSWSRDAIDFGRRLQAVDPSSEQASRAVMLGFAGIGELHHAVQEHERCRRMLADELGLDPSPQTRAAYQQVLQPPPRRMPTPHLVGREAEMRWLRGILEQEGTDTDGPTVVVVAGEDGSGRRRAVLAVCNQSGRAVTQVHTAPELAGGTRCRQDVVLWRPEVSTDMPMVTKLFEDAASVTDASTVVVLGPAQGEHFAWDAALATHQVPSIQLPPLLPHDVAALASSLLTAAVTPALVDALIRESDGMPGRVAATVRRWAESGRLVATGAGLALAPVIDADADDQWGRRVFERVVPRLEGDAFDVLLLAAVLDEPVTPSVLAPLLDRPQDRAKSRTDAALEQLVDLGLLRTSAGGAVWRDPRLQDAVRAWLRPTMRRRLHARVARGAAIPDGSRTRHWIEAGERELACVSALHAAEESCARGDHGGARHHLLQVFELGALPETTSGDQAELLELLGDACLRLSLPDEAGTAYGRALDLAVAHVLPQAARLRRKVASATDPRALEITPEVRTLEWSSALSSFAVRTTTTPAEMQEALVEAIASADAGGDVRSGIEARLLLAGGVHLPRRDFGQVRELVDRAVAMGPAPQVRVRAEVLVHLAGVLLGEAAERRERLETAAAVAEHLGAERTAWHLLGLRVLVAHDLGLPTFDELFAVLTDRVRTGSVDALVPELAGIAVRVLAEREEVDLALEMTNHLSFAGGDTHPLADHVARIARADLACLVGERRTAGTLLQSVVEEGTGLGCTLLVPEAAAKLVLVEAEHDLDAARATFDHFDEVVGVGHGGPREEFWRRLARAELRYATGDVERALRACGEATAVASQHGLHVLAARGRRARAHYVRGSRSLSVLGRPTSRRELDPAADQGHGRAPSTLASIASRRTAP